MLLITSSIKLMLGEKKKKKESKHQNKLYRDNSLNDQKFEIGWEMMFIVS